jgi:hypothetical protein
VREALSGQHSAFSLKPPLVKPSETLSAVHPSAAKTSSIFPHSNSYNRKGREENEGFGRKLTAESFYVCRVGGALLESVVCS